jgi:hypothetical protein
MRKGGFEKKNKGNLRRSFATTKNNVPGSLCAGGAVRIAAMHVPREGFGWWRVCKARARVCLDRPTTDLGVGGLELNDPGFRRTFLVLHLGGLGHPFALFFLDQG